MTHRPPIVYPYATGALEDVDWPAVPPRAVAVAALVPTQADVAIARVVHHVNGGTPETGDPLPHVIDHDGRLHIHDGHHRYLIALCRGEGWIDARIVTPDGTPR